MSWLIREIVVALILAGCIGVFLGLAVAWTFTAKETANPNIADDRAQLQEKIRELKAQNKRLHLAFSKDHSQQIENSPNSEPQPELTASIFGAPSL